MSYEEAKNIVRNFFDGISQPTRIVMEALEIISERDYFNIQNEQQIKEVTE